MKGNYVAPFSFLHLQINILQHFLKCKGHLPNGRSPEIVPGFHPRAEGYLGLGFTIYKNRVLWQITNTVFLEIIEFLI